MQVSKATSSIIRLFISLYIHYNRDIKVQKQNETKVKRLKTKVVNSVILRIHCNTFFQYTSSFPKFSVKQAMRKLSGINFNNINRLHLVLAIRIYFDKNLNYPRVYTNSKAGQIKITSQVPNLLNMFKTKNYMYQIKQGR